MVNEDGIRGFMGNIICMKEVWMEWTLLQHEA